MEKYRSLVRNVTRSQITCFRKKNAFKQCILTINQHKELSVDRICKVKVSDENKILINQSMLESYQKYKCCVFIAFEYIFAYIFVIEIGCKAFLLTLADPKWAFGREFILLAPLFSKALHGKIRVFVIMRYGRFKRCFSIPSPRNGDSFLKFPRSYDAFC